MEEMHKIEDVARMLSLTPQTIRKWIKKGQVEATKIGRHWYFDKNQLEKILQGLPDPRWDI